MAEDWNSTRLSTTSCWFDISREAVRRRRLLYWWYLWMTYRTNQVSTQLWKFDHILNLFLPFMYHTWDHGEIRIIQGWLRIQDIGPRWPKIDMKMDAQEWSFLNRRNYSSIQGSGKGLIRLNFAIGNRTTHLCFALLGTMISFTAKKVLRSVSTWGNRQYLELNGHLQVHRYFQRFSWLLLVAFTVSQDLRK